jgi:hypothetical protein
MSSAADELPPAGLAELLPVLGMLALIVLVLLYGCGCLGSSPSPVNKKTLGRPGSGKEYLCFWPLTRFTSARCIARHDLLSKSFTNVHINSISLDEWS